MGGQVSQLQMGIVFCRYVLAIRVLERVLTGIRCGRFNPDASRSGMFLPDRVLIEVKDELEEAHDVAWARGKTAVDDSSAYATSSSSTDESGV